MSFNRVKKVDAAYINTFLSLVANVSHQDMQIYRAKDKAGVLFAPFCSLLENMVETEINARASHAIQEALLYGAAYFLKQKIEKEELIPRTLKICFTLQHEYEIETTLIAVFKGFAEACDQIHQNADANLFDASDILQIIYRIIRDEFDAPAPLHVSEIVNFFHPKEKRLGIFHLVSMPDLYFDNRVLSSLSKLGHVNFAVRESRMQQRNSTAVVVAATKAESRKARAKRERIIEDDGNHKPAVKKLATIVKTPDPLATSGSYTAFQIAVMNLDDDTYLAMAKTLGKQTMSFFNPVNKKSFERTLVANQVDCIFSGGVVTMVGWNEAHAKKLLQDICTALVSGKPPALSHFHRLMQPLTLLPADAIFTAKIFLYALTLFDEYAERLLNQNAVTSYIKDVLCFLTPLLPTGMPRNLINENETTITMIRETLTSMSQLIPQKIATLTRFCEPIQQELEAQKQSHSIALG